MGDDPIPDLADIEVADVPRALSDPIRLQIPWVLAEGGTRQKGVPKWWCDVTKATMSHHFKIMREAGLTSTIVDGWTYGVLLRQEASEFRTQAVHRLRCAPEQRPRAAQSQSASLHFRPFNSGLQALILSSDRSVGARMAPSVVLRPFVAAAKTGGARGEEAPGRALPDAGRCPWSGPRLTLTAVSGELMGTAKGPERAGFRDATPASFVAYNGSWTEQVEGCRSSPAAASSLFPPLPCWRSTSH